MYPGVLEGQSQTNTSVKWYKHVFEGFALRNSHFLCEKRKWLQCKHYHSWQRTLIISSDNDDSAEFETGCDLFNIAAQFCVCDVNTGKTESDIRKQDSGFCR